MADVEISKIIYFSEPGLSNTDQILEHSKERLEALKINHVIIASNTGFTAKKALAIFNDLKVNVIVVTNTKNSKMPVSYLYKKYKKSKEIREAYLTEGIKDLPISISDETQVEFEKKGIRVFFMPDILSISGTLGPENERRNMKTKLDAFLPRHLRPLDIEAGADLSLLNIIGMGFRVAVGITAVAVRNDLVPKGEMVLSIAGTGWAGGGADTAVIMQASPNPRKCYIREIIGFPKLK